MEKSERLPRRYRQGPGDVFALVKHELADDELLQPPLLVFPHDAAGQVPEFWRSAADHRGVKTNLDPERAQALKELAEALGAYPQYGRAVDYMRSLAGVAPYRRVDALPLDFVRRAGPVPPSFVVANLPPRRDRPVAHNLHVRFHR